MISLLIFLWRTTLGHLAGGFATALANIVRRPHVQPAFAWRRLAVRLAQSCSGWKHVAPAFGSGAPPPLAFGAAPALGYWRGDPALPCGRFAYFPG